LIISVKRKFARRKSIGNDCGRAFRAFAAGDDEWRAAVMTVLELGGVNALNEFTKQRKKRI